MIKQRTTLCIVGQRPKLIKILRVIGALQDSNWTKYVVIVIAQAQQRNILDQILTQFNIKIDCHLSLMQAIQGLTKLLTRMLPALNKIIQKAVLGQSSTVTVFGAGLSVNQVPFKHINPRLRIYDLEQLFSKKGYRQIFSSILYW